MKRKFCRVIVCFLALFFFSFTTIKADTLGSLIVSCPQESMSVSLYRVADTEYNLVGSFSKYSVSLKEEDLSGVANVLEDHILKDHIQPDYTSVSQSDKNAVFTGLDSGIYLIVPSTSKEYTFQCSFVSIIDDSEITSVLKYESKNTSSYIHVLKVWKQDSKKQRPTSISVDLLQTDAKGNTKVFDTQVLNAQNEWSYTWQDLSTDYSYRVLETKVPNGYKESLAREKNTVVLTNTADKTKHDKEKNEEDLPLTGQLWWPVPLLLFAGMSLYGLGKHLR